MSETTLPRQTGEDHESTRPCPNCGAPLAVVKRESGSLTSVNCESCWPSTPVGDEAAPPQLASVPGGGNDLPVLTGQTDLGNDDGEPGGDD